ncbi:uncharacterized protein LOC131183007 [Hevea brasiliensis]|uniref:uncharacterized protein LOC131183007 n=1 Tax=Hevea brasiliensis TaxID=3981 RepID=UPI0025F8F560|nr:uncharacterized protein LOC131183007 [Hevea brasiliensis]
MPSPKTKRDVRSFLGKLNHISRFISNLIAKAKPIFKLLKKNNTAKWDQACQEAFERIKQYLSNPPILVPSMMGRPLILYMAVQQSLMGYVLGQHDETGRKERAIYYLSKKLNECKSRYSFLEKTYFYMIRKAVKKSVIAYLLAENPINDYEALDFKFLDEYINAVGDDAEGPNDVWEMYFNRDVSLADNGIGAVLVASDRKHFPIAVKLRFNCTNNVAEYEVCLSSLQAAIEMKIKKLEAYRDSVLIIYQVKGEWQTKDLKLVPYQKYLLELIKKFEEISFTHLNQDKNQFVDSLATLAMMTQMEEGEIITDNTKNLNGQKIQKLCDQYKIRHLNSSPYRSQMNKVREAANKNLKRIIRK